MSVLRSLDLAASRAAEAINDATPQQLHVLQQLQQVAGIGAGLEHRQGAGLVAQLPELSSRLPAATKLADLLHEWYQPAMQPEQHADAQLALAQAAATRSCAYLRCANLGGGGGPAAGEGVGSQRCRWVGRWSGSGG